MYGGRNVTPRLNVKQVHTELTRWLRPGTAVDFYQLGEFLALSHQCKLYQVVLLLRTKGGHLISSTFYSEKYYLTATKDFRDCGVVRSNNCFSACKGCFTAV